MASTDLAAEVKGGDFLADSPGAIVTPEAFDADENLMVDTAKQFNRGEVLPVIERLEKQEEGLMPALLKKMGPLGLAGPETPEKYGGLGLSKALGTRILEMLSLNGSFSTTAAVHMGIGQAPIYLWGNEFQREKYLPLLTSGEWMSAYALSEPNSGSDALGMSARAIRAGDEYLLSGTKMWISNAKWANLFVAFAKTEDNEVTCFLVERDFPGVTIGPEEHKTGLKGSSTARLILDGARVPSENVLYKPGEGHRVAFNALNLGRLKLGSMSLGPGRAAMHFSAKYAKERKQFGKPIAEFGLIRDKLARMAALSFASESVLYRTCGLVDIAFSRVTSSDDVEENRKACEEFALECSANKVLATETLAYIADEAIQIHGGYGFTEEFPVARVWRDARVTRIYEGTNEINRLFIFDRIRKKGLLAELLDVKPQTFAHGLLIDAARAASDTQDQQTIAALSDLAIIHFAQQSAVARASQVTQAREFAESAALMYCAISDAVAASRAAEALARAGHPREITLPAPNLGGTEILASAVLDASGYPIG
jgi:alkylation response protein AidB-like acyl-CoA dehydrogenase